MVGLLFFKQRAFIYFPDKNMPDKAAVNAEGVAQDISVTTDDGLKLSAWFIPPGTPDKPVILFFHGNAGNISHRLFKVSDYTNAGYGVLMAEYRGYGGNASMPTEDGLYRDGRAYFAWLHERGYQSGDIIIYGESLGTGVAVQMASEYDVRALILEAPYARLSDPARRTYFFIPFIDALMHDKYHSVDKIGAIDAPKFFMIAGQDEVLGAQTGLALYEAAQIPKTLSVFKDAQHNTIYDYGAGAAVLAFLSRL
ncbi:MAG: alpha/beta hydrolase [Alphaproteobacteria bacterium]